MKLWGFIIGLVFGVIFFCFLIFTRNLIYPKTKVLVKEKNVTVTEKAVIINFEVNDCLKWHETEELERWEQDDPIIKLAEKGKKSFRKLVWIDSEWQKSSFSLSFESLKYYEKVACPN